MKRLVLVLTLLSGMNAFALGPIPNGTYTGLENCSGYPSMSTRFVVTDTTMQWDEQTLAFEADRNGFFRMHSLNGDTTNAIGHFTKNGLHYEVVEEITMNGKTVAVPGEDTLTYNQGVLELTASASMQSGGTIYCSGKFKKQ